MISSPKKCINCNLAGTRDMWNGMDVLICDICKLAWRVSFDLPNDYYHNLNYGRDEPGDNKKDARLRNDKDRYESIKKYLPVNNICDIGCGDGSFLSILKKEGYNSCFGIEPSI